MIGERTIMIKGIPLSFKLYDRTMIRIAVSRFHIDSL